MKAQELAQVFNHPFFDRLMAGRLLPGQVVALAGLATILLGTVLLLLPVATVPGVHLRFLDALFTATSAVCVTGLIVMNTPHDFTLFGQFVILLLIQVGGLGYAIIATLLLLALGKRIGLRERMQMAEALSTLDMAGLVQFVKTIVIVTCLIEGIGWIFLSWQFMQDMEPDSAIYLGLFHSVSAFNNAGFSLFSDSLVRYRGEATVVFIVTTQMLLGGLGFIVFKDIWENVQGRSFRFQTHTKLVAVVTVGLIVIGTIGIWLLEARNPRTFAGMPVGEQFLTAYFHSVTARTTGFNTMNLDLMRDATLYFLILLMAVGGSPGSAAGGIKTTAFAVVCLSVWALLRRRADVEIFHRRIPNGLVVRATGLAILAMATVTFFTLLLAYTEGKSFLHLLFEVTSAMGTVGLSVGDGGARSFSALFTDSGKLVIILAMFLGRFGPLTIGLFAIKTHTQMHYRYPEAKVVIG